jgi:hypothetical protein
MNKQRVRLALDFSSRESIKVRRRAARQLTCDNADAIRNSRAPSPTRPLSLTRSLDERTHTDIASTLLSTQPPHRQRDSTIELTATMSMKRKRSTGSLFQTPTFEATSSSTPFSGSPIRLPNFFVQSKTYEPQSSPFTPKHHTQEEEHTPQNLNSRTRKRYRDARPEESQIHGTSLFFHHTSILSLENILTTLIASTVEKLFQAQKAHPHASPQPSQPQLQYSTQFPPQEAQPLQKSTLHSFWHLPQTSQTPQYEMAPRIPQQEIVVCDGCDGLLQSESPYGMDTLDVETMCTACGKHVCNTCAITAETRLCLDCAMQG